MKKTLITLLAVASCAMGATLDDAILTFSGDAIPATYTTSAGGNTDGVDLNTSTKAISVAVSLDVTTLKSYLTDSSEGTHMIVGHQGNGGNGLYSSGVVSQSTGTYAGGLTGSWKQTLAYGDTTLVTGLSNPTEWSWDNVSGAGLVYVFNGMNDNGEVKKGTSVCLTLVDSNNNVLYTQTGTLVGLVSTWGDFRDVYFDTDVVTLAYVFDRALGTTDMAAMAGQLAQIPEPATATLSLLALCGLAMRRRRK